MRSFKISRIAWILLLLLLLPLLLLLFVIVSTELMHNSNSFNVRLLLVFLSLWIQTDNHTGSKQNVDKLWHFFNFLKNNSILFFICQNKQTRAQCITNWRAVSAQFQNYSTWTSVRYAIVCVQFFFRLFHFFVHAWICFAFLHKFSASSAANWIYTEKTCKRQLKSLEYHAWTILGSEAITEQMFQRSNCFRFQRNVLASVNLLQFRVYSNCFE